MLSINVVFDDKKVGSCITKHVNDKTQNLINWYTSTNEASDFLPYGFSSAESEDVIRLLKRAVESDELLELTDHRLQFALSCILEEEEKITDINRGLSAKFTEDDRMKLAEYLPEDTIRYYENYDNFKDLLLPDNSYLDLAMKYQPKTHMLT